MIPLSLYIHTPWCIKKCPYCDFNSHQSPAELPEFAYVDVLLKDLATDLEWFNQRRVQSIFIGGGTPSLISPAAYERLFIGLENKLQFNEDIEITLEANPGTVEQQRFQAYRRLGINRLSLGIQSFNPEHLNRLGRIHDDNQAHRAIVSAREAGFTNMNIDIMHGLPQQTVEQGLKDLEQALCYQPEHLSWYQLTIEPNTLFYKQRPPLPGEETLEILETEGLSLLEANGLSRYEISAFSRPGKMSQHNLNYWLFGDYLGIGAGAHGKLTQQNIYRTRKQRQPMNYLDPKMSFLVEKIQVPQNEILFEFMLNTTRLEQAIPKSLLQEHTGLAFDAVAHLFEQAEEKGLIAIHKKDWQVTSFGRRYTNDLQSLFLSE